MNKYVKLYEEFLYSLNEDKKDLILYHGTPYQFDKFDIEKSSPYQLYGKGIYLTDNINVAKNYKGGILNKKSNNSHIKKCIITSSNFKNIDDKITDIEINELAKLVKDNNDDFWFKRINLNNKPKKWDKDFYINPKYINRKDLEKFAKLSKDDGYYQYNYLTFRDVFGILTDDFNTIHSKVHIRNYLINKGFSGLIIPTIGDGLSNNDLVQNIYCLFDDKNIKIVETIKENINVDITETINIDGDDKPTRNNLGEFIANDIDKIINFYKWFGKSKAVDKLNRPYVFYHTSQTKFEIFQQSKFGKMGNGIYFTTDMSYIKRLNNQYLYECYLKCENPLYLENPFGKRNLNGNDSIITRLGDEADEIVVYNPNQVKSINNIGTFNTNNQNIYK